MKVKADADRERLRITNDDGVAMFHHNAKVQVLDGGSYCDGVVAGHGWMADGQWFYRVQFQGQRSSTVSVRLLMKFTRCQDCRKC